MNIVIGADHRGFAHKEFIKHALSSTGTDITWIDVGAYDQARSDYPVFVAAACQKVRLGDADLGVLLCGSGVGMSIAANRFANIYAALAWNEKVACMSRQDDNANVLVLPADFVTKQESVHIVKAWLKAEFKQGRYQERLAMIDAFGGV